MAGPRSEDTRQDLIRRLDALYRAGRPLTDPTCVLLSQQLDRQILGWYREAGRGGPVPSPDGGKER